MLILRPGEAFSASIVSPVQLHCPLGNRQSQTRASTAGHARLFHADEGVEDAAQQFLRNPRTVVPHRHQRGMIGFRERQTEVEPRGE